MEMEDHYGLADPRHLMSGRLHFPPISPPPPPDLYSGHRNHLAPPPSQPYEMLMMAPPGSSHDIMMHHHHHHQDHDQFPTSDYNAHGSVTAATPAGAFGGGLEAVDMGCLGGDGGTGRWPRQETLTLLEIRSRLDSKFKEANQKGPLWDEVSRIMNEEHGYQRSGKKCREKFENLYKYYKKTKEGKAGRQDGKHYRFFRQLEALYGGGGATCDTAAYNNSHQFTAPQAVPQPQKQKLSDSLSLSNNSSELDTSSSHHHDDDDSAEAAEKGKKRASGGKRSWKAKIREFVDSQMRRLVEKQETWLETMQRSLEHKERERMLRDDAWRKQEASRMDRQQRFWASERAWIKARDAALVEALHTLTSQSQTKNPATTDNDGWSDCEIARLVQLRTGMDERFGHIGCSEEVLWEEIAAEMGYQRSASMCKQKWTDITNDDNNNNNNNNALLFLKECNVMSNKKRKEHSARSYCYFPTAADSGYDHVVGAGAAAETVPYFEMDDERGPKMAAQTSELLNGSSSSSPCDPPPNGAAQVQEGCFRMLMANGGSNLWEDYGLKLN